MKTKNTLFTLNIQLFAEGAGGAGDGGGGAGAEGAGVTAVAAGQQASGVGAVDAGQQEKGVISADAGQTGDNLNAEFEELIKGKFKSHFDAEMQKVIRERLKAPSRDLKAAREQLQRYEPAEPIFQFLAQRYGLEATDLEGIGKALEEDVSLFEKEAFASGKDPEELMQIRKTERENASMRQQLEAQRQAQKEAEMRQNVNRQVQEWEQQAEEAKKVYPGLNLATEMQNTAFQTLLRNGFNVKNAYEALHTQEILQAGMAYASQKGAQAVTDNIIAGKGRPSENGTSAQGAMATRLDPATMTRKQRQDLIARAGRGERITL